MSLTNLAAGAFVVAFLFALLLASRLSYNAALDLRDLAFEFDAKFPDMKRDC